jgi:hypothetical protein
MKNRNTWIVGLFVLGIALFAIVRFFVIPHRQAERQKYLTAQQEPATHDLGAVLKYKSKYMGNASNDANLFYNLPLSNTGMDFQLFPEKLALEVNYKDTVWNVGEEKVKRSLLYNSTTAFALIDNLQEIDYNFPGVSYRVKRTDIEALYPNFTDILQTDQWKTSVQMKMDDTRYVDETFRKVFQ